jgi:dihydroorotate dehydrogenase (fumarate)
MEEFGAGAVVLHSLFEEQLRAQEEELNQRLEQGSESFAESLSYFPKMSTYRLGPEDYLEHIKKAKKAVKIPIIASLNATSLGSWTEFAQKIEEAGADALELNIYTVPTDEKLSSEKIEQEYLKIVMAIKSMVSIPVAVKLSPYFSNLTKLVHNLDQTGVDGLVLFNRFYQPDINIDTLDIESKVPLSSSHENQLSLRWIGILSGKVGTDLVASGGIHTHKDVLKLIMAGAQVTMLCSSLYKNGIPHLKTINDQMVNWMKKNKYHSLQDLRGSMSQEKTSNPSAFQRAQFIKALQSGG